MRNLISGDTADECLVKTLKALNRDGCAIAIPALGTAHYFSCPVVISLENPLARFSFFHFWDPRESIILGLCAFAGINDDDLLPAFGLTFKPFLPGPYFRGFNSETNPYHVRLKNAGSRIGNVDQLLIAVEHLKLYPGASFTVSLRDPKKGTDHGSGIAVSMRFYSDDAMRLCASVYVPELEAIKQLVSYIIPTYTFVQQIVAYILGKKLGPFYIISDTVHYAECDESRIILTKPQPHIKGLRDFGYQESKEFDLRYLDMIIQHLVGFIRRIRDGDLLVENPFKNPGHLEVFRDYGEVFRYAEAVDRKISWDGEHEIKHPQLAYYYDF
jgi:hypothetical protein